MNVPKEVESVIWDDTKKIWITTKVQIQEYHGFTECRYCHEPISHNVKTNGEFKVIYTKCACNRAN